jgi:hypothetical protein
MSRFIVLDALRLEEEEFRSRFDFATLDLFTGSLGALFLLRPLPPPRNF